MATTAIDTLRYARKLKDAGVPPIQAEAMADAIGSELVAQLATKSDIAELESRLEAKIAALDSKLDSNIVRLEAKIDAGIAGLEAKLDSNIARLEAKIDQNKEWSAGQFRLLHWMFGFTLAFVVAIAWRVFTL